MIPFITVAVIILITYTLIKIIVFRKEKKEVDKLIKDYPAQKKQTF